MKKLYASLISLAVAICLLAGACTLVCADLCRSGENVTVSHEVIYGDLSALDGLAVTLRHHMGYTLLWETDLTFRNGPIPDTDLTCHISRNTMYTSIEVPEDIIPGILLSDYYGSLLAFEPVGENYGIAAEYERLLDSIPEGGTATSTYRLRDYTDRIPLLFQYGLSGLTPPESWRYEINEKEPWQETANRILDYFAMPLPEDAELKFTVRRDENGRQNAVELTGTPTVKSLSFATEDAIYLTFRFTGDTDSLDTDAMAQGFGVYHIPLDNTRNGPERILVDEITRFFPLDTGILPLELKPDPVTGHLMLLGMEGEETFLMVLDKTDGHLIGKTSLHRFTPTDYAMTVQEDVTLLIDSHRIQILSRREDGSYGTDSEVCPGEAYQWEDPGFMTTLNYAFAYDGERLAILRDHPTEGLEIVVLKDSTVLVHVLCVTSLHKEQRYYSVCLCPPMPTRKYALEAGWAP